MAKRKEVYLSKSEVLSTIQNYIRNIQMSDYGDDKGIPQLYNVMKQIDEMTSVELDYVKGISLEEVIVDIKDWFVNYYDSSDYIIKKMRSIVNYIRREYNKREEIRKL